MGEAIEHKAYNAINALAENGCDIDAATESTMSTIEFATLYDGVDRIIQFLVRKGVSVEFQDIVDLWIWDNNPELAHKVINSAPIEDIHILCYQSRCQGTPAKRRYEILGTKIELIIKQFNINPTFIRTSDLTLRSSFFGKNNSGCVIRDRTARKEFLQTHPS